MRSLTLVGLLLCCSFAGAEEKHWAFRPLAKPAVPRQIGANTPVDSFVLAKLRAKKLQLAQPADRITLIRRLSLDLIGLPPTANQVRSFLNDRSPDFVGRLVDALLASPRFGERWGRHWLDVVGYVDTVGFDIDANLILATDGKWRYRDYVIRAFNDGTPYNQFLLEQVAGDEMFDRKKVDGYSEHQRRLLIATGFWRTAQDFSHEPESDIPLSYYKVLHDTVAIVTNSLLALTVNCAQCHSHKFDPISHDDYYQFMALMTTAYNPSDWLAVYPYRAHVKDRTLLDVTDKQKKAMDAFNNGLQLKINPLKAELKKLDEKLKQEKSAAGKKAIVASGNGIKRQIDSLELQRKRYGKIQALFNVGKPHSDRLFKRGDFRTPGHKVEPGFLSALSNQHTKQLVKRMRSMKNQQRRLTMARWLTDRESPASALVARVFVNRVWQHLFGRGLVRTEDNFGIQGEEPTHPQLLDWLCQNFIDSGWEIKPLIRMMVMSRVYQQATYGDESSTETRMAWERATKTDPDNRLLWKMTLRRLESEVIRDSMLQASGQLDLTMGGKPVSLKALKDGMVVLNGGSGSERHRRGVYLLGRRTFNLTMMTVFDQPQVAINCPRRDRSAVVLQSLTLLNDPFAQQQANKMAERVIREAGKKTTKQVDRVFRITLCRPADTAERALANRYLKQQAQVFSKDGKKPAEAEKLALVSLCQSLMNTSEFLYTP